MAGTAPDGPGPERGLTTKSLPRGWFDCGPVSAAKVQKRTRIREIFHEKFAALLLLINNFLNQMPPISATTKSRVFFRLMVVVFFLAAILTVRSMPPSGVDPGSASRLVAFVGKVEVTTADTNDWQDARINQILLPGDRLHTEADSRATLQLSDRSVIRIAANTILEIQPPRPPAQHRFNLKHGMLYFLDREKPADVEFETPLTTGAIRGTEFLLSVADADDTSRLTMFDGEVKLLNSHGEITLTNGQEIILSREQSPKIAAVPPSVNSIQWTFYYPAVINPEDISFSSPERSVLAKSLTAYLQGDLLQALASAPPETSISTDAGKIYLATLKLSVGEVAAAEKLIASVGEPATPIRELIATVRGQRVSPLGAPSNSSGWLARSYYLQSRSQLPGALKAAQRAANLSPDSGFAWERVAELEFDFQHLQAALEALGRAKKLAPRLASAMALEGYISLAANSPSQALRSFNQALTLDDSLPLAWLGRGLTEAALGNDQEARRNLQIAAVLEPTRGLFRSYLGKAWSQTGDDKLAERDFDLAKQLDPADPTAWLYSALHRFQTHQVNDAVRDLERSVELNDNRSVFRSQLLLDRDRATRSADLSSVYNAAGLDEVSRAAASRAVEESYSDFSGHLFLANSFAAQEDPEHYDLRFETVRESEQLVANLLAPPGGGNLSQLLPQQDHLENFAARPFGASTLSDYDSRGDWSESATAFGSIQNFSYALDTQYVAHNGQEANNDSKNFQFAFHMRQQVTAADSAYFSVDTFEGSSGDVAQHYDPAEAIIGLHANENQTPNLFAGWNHEWSPNSHTLFLFSRLTDHLSLTNPQPSVLFIQQNGSGIAGVTADPYFALNQQEDFTLYSAEAQQIWETEHQSVILGGRIQRGSVDSETSLTRLFGANTLQSVSPYLQRLDGYGYYELHPVDELWLTAGFSYDRLTYPLNVDLPPVGGDEAHRSLPGPKAGFTAEPWLGGWFHGGWTRSLGGLFFDNSIRLEPAEIDGSVSAFRNLIPDSVEGLVPGTRFDSWSIGYDQEFQSQTYFGAGAELLTSSGSRGVGAFSNSIPFINVPDSPTTTSQSLDYRERNASAYIAQLLGRDYSIGARYRISEARLETALGGLAGVPGVASLDQNQRAVLQHGQIFFIYNHPNGLFAEWSSDWYHQANHGDDSGLPGDDFWQQNVFAGYVFCHRRAELRLGLLNLTGQDYRLNPLNLQSELARGRTFTASFRFNY
jgi:Flp pilus assembly protein TadD